MNNEFTENLMDGIIDAATTSGVNLTTDDVKNIAIYTLHSIVTAHSKIEVESIKKCLCEIIGNDDKIGEFLFTTSCGIDAANDELIDKKILIDEVIAEKGDVKW